MVARVATELPSPPPPSPERYSASARRPIDQPRLSTLFALLLVGIAVLLVIENARTLV